VRLEGRVFLHRNTFGGTGYNRWYAVFRDGAVPGRLVCTGAGTGTTEIAAVQLYTGGTEIEDGGPDAYPLKLFGSGRMPDTGDILIHTNSVIDFNSIGDTVGSLAGVGKVVLGSAVVTCLEGVSPGTNGESFGTLVVTGTTGRIVLSPDSVSTFHLRTPGIQDRVAIQGSAGLTLGGTVKVEAKERIIAAGAYTLFELNGGPLDGTIPALALPRGCSGSIETNGGNVVLYLQVSDHGALLMLW
jgi:hypothetical protein